MNQLKNYLHSLFPEQKQLLKQKIIWISIIIFVPIVLLLLFDLHTWILSLTTPEIALIDDNCYVEYDNYTKKSECEIELIFNVPVDSGYATIAFYDKNDVLLATKENYFSCYNDTTVTATIYSIDGEVEFYEVVSYDFPAYHAYPAENIWLTLLALWLFLWIFPPVSIFLIASLIGTLRQTCYVYKNDNKEIVVYAGKKQQYIKIDGEKYDEHNAHIPFSQTVTLTAKIENGNEYQAFIPKNKKTTLKVTGKLLEPISK